MPIPSSRSAKAGEGRGYPRAKTNAPRPSGENNYADSPAAPAKVAAPVADGNTSFAVPVDAVRELVKMVADNDLTELTFDNGSQKISIKRERPVTQVITETAQGGRASRLARNQAAVPTAAAVSSTMPVPDPGSPPEDSFHKITAPMVGTFYRSPDPKAKAFVAEGDVVEKDQVIGIIEAMKIMNEIKSEHRGRCVKISVENGQPVEYGQTLILLEPV